MKNKLITLVYIALVLASFSLQAQNNDSLTFVKAKWNKEKIAKGVELKTYHFKGDEKLFDAPQYVAVLEIDMKKAGRKFAFAADTTFRTASYFADASGAIAAINGNFFSWSTKQSVDYLRIKGVRVSANSLLKGDKRAAHQKASLLIDKNGKLDIAAADTTDVNWEEKQTAYEMMNTGPMLVEGGERSFLPSVSFNTARHPRSAMASAQKGKKVYMIVVDGRAADNSAGVSLFELASLSKWLGSEKAVNLDGGGSTTLYVKTKNGGKVVNHPSDNKKFDNEGQRKVANVVLLL